MNSYFSQGDLVRLPQGIILYKKQNKPDAYNGAMIGLKRLDANSIAIYAGQDINDFSRVIIDGTEFYVENEDVHEGDTYAS